VINGQLHVRQRKGIRTQTLNVQINLDLGGRPSKAVYTVRDAFGSTLEEMTVIRSKSGSRFEYAAGDPLTASDVPDLYGPIQGTDISWMDLTLSFLWWPGGTTIGTETVKGQPCFVVDVSAASGEDGKYGRVRLWIAEKFRMILRAEGYDSQGVLLRRLWVKSFKKIDDRWMIKDMEVKSASSTHRTRLRVDQVSVNAGYDGDIDH
jgi:hypothetical protein